MSPIRHYFAGGYTSIGFYSLFNDVHPHLERLYVLVGSTNTLKSKMIQQLGEIFNEKGHNVEYIHSLHDTNEVEGLIVPNLRLGVIDGNSGHDIYLSYPGIRDIYIDFSSAFKPTLEPENKKHLLDLLYLHRNLLKQMFEQFALAKKAHDRKEKIYVAAMNFPKANYVTDHLIATIFDQQPRLDTLADERHFFLGASTSNGPINFIDHLTEQTTKRYIIKGRSGSGKSTLMRKVANKALELGLQVEYYHCSFDPHSIDMIIIPALCIAILDGTAPHVIDPSRDTDEVIDMFTLTIDPMVENHYASELQEISAEYQRHIQAAISLLKEIKNVYTTIEANYLNHVDHTIYAQMERTWIKKIMDYVEHPF